MDLATKTKPKTKAKAPALKTPKVKLPAVGQRSIFDIPTAPPKVDALADTKTTVEAGDGPPIFQRAVVVSDGSNYGQPGPAGWSAIVTVGNETTEHSGRLVSATNNQAELMGAIEGLKRVPEGMAAKLITDSQYILNGVYHHKLIAKAKRADAKMANGDLWLQLGDLMADRIVEIEWVKGHNGHPANERADVLARKAATTERDEQAEAEAKRTRDQLLTVTTALSVGQPYQVAYDLSPEEVKRLADVGEVLVEDGAILAHGWPASLSAKVAWFVRAYRRGALPGEPFKIRKGVTINDPGLFYSRLRFGLAIGPRGANELALDNLSRLYDLYRNGADVQDMRLQLQVLHRGAPKMVCIVFKHEGRLIAFHEATATQNYGALACPGGVDRAALLFLRRAGVSEWHHWTKPAGPLWKTGIVTLMEEGIPRVADDRDRFFLPVPSWRTEDALPYKPPWISAKNAIVLDPFTCERVEVAPSTGKTPRNIRGENGRK